MEFCKKLIDGCDSLVFSRLLGKITSGVGIEINHALTHNKPVYEMKDGRMENVKKGVKYVSREHTIQLYEKWRIQNLVI